MKKGCTFQNEVHSSVTNKPRQQIHSNSFGSAFLLSKDLRILIISGTSFSTITYIIFQNLFCSLHKNISPTGIQSLPILKSYLDLTVIVWSYQLDREALTIWGRYAMMPTSTTLFS